MSEASGAPRARPVASAPTGRLPAGIQEVRTSRAIAFAAPDVEAWVRGSEANYGWVMPAWPLRLDGTGIAPSESAVIAV